MRLAKSVDEVGANAAAMLGHELVTKQTGPVGRTVKRLYIEEGCDIKRELYISMLVDRTASRVAVVASTEGGMDIETVAHETPEKIVTQTIDPQPASRATRAASLPLPLGFPASRWAPSWR